MKIEGEVSAGVSLNQQVMIHFLWKLESRHRVWTSCFIAGRIVSAGKGVRRMMIRCLAVVYVAVSHSSCRDCE